MTKLKSNINARKFVTPINIILVVMTIMTISLSLAPESFIVRQFTDDTFYFYETAQNMAEGKGMTFDSIHQTNGMQIIWVLILVPFYWIFSGVWLPLRASIVLQGIIMILATVLFYKCVRKLFDKNIAVIASVALVFNPYIIFIYLGGHEGAINYLFISSILYILIFKSPSKPTFALLGLTCGLAFLARLDNIILVSILAGTLVGSRIINNVRDLIIFSTSTAVLPMLYILYNIISFEQIVPVSAKVHGTSSTTITISYVIMCGVLGILLSYLITKLGAEKREIGIFGSRAVVSMFALAATMHLLFYIFFSRKLAVWYLPLETIAGAIVGCFILMIAFRFLSNRKQPDYRKVVSLIIILLLLSSYVGLGAIDKLDPQTDTNGEVMYEQAQWLQSNTACDAVIAAGNAGILGYFSQRSVVETLGLANSYKFYAKYQGNEVEYITEKRPDYYADYTLLRPNRINPNSYNYTRINIIRKINRVQTLQQPRTILNPRERAIVHRVWVSNKHEVERNSESNCN